MSQPLFWNQSSMTQNHNSLLSLAQHPTDSLAQEIALREKVLRWLIQMNWPIPVHDAIMMHDSPTIPALINLVYRHGPDKALVIILEMMDD